MYQLSPELWIKVRVYSKATKYDARKPSTTLENGTIHIADLVIVADD